jgi:glycosyltransferase involved in cell wall biosynthesis
MPEIVEHRNTGFLVGSAEQAVAAVALLPDIDPQNCRLRAEQHFSRKAMVSSYLQIYEQVLSASPK